MRSNRENRIKESIRSRYQRDSRHTRPGPTKNPVPPSHNDTSATSLTITLGFYSRRTRRARYRRELSLRNFEGCAAFCNAAGVRPPTRYPMGDGEVRDGG